MGVSGKGLPIHGKETLGEVLLGLPVMLGSRQLTLIMRIVEQKKRIFLILLSTAFFFF